MDGITVEHFTAKDFRTWAGTVLACEMLKEFEAFGTAKEAKRNVVKAVREVASHLGNTPAVCRKCYVHPAVLESYMNGVLAGAHGSGAMVEAVESASSLRQEEAALMKLLQGSLKTKTA